MINDLQELVKKWRKRSTSFNKTRWPRHEVDVFRTCAEDLERVLDNQWRKGEPPAEVKVVLRCKVGDDVSTVSKRFPRGWGVAGLRGPAKWRESWRWMLLPKPPELEEGDA